MYEHFIKKKQEVQEEGKVRTFKRGSAPAGKPRNVILCGLEGSGRTALANETARLLDMQVAAPDAADGVSALAPFAESGGHIVIIGPGHLQDSDSAALIPRLGHVFFLMADVPFLIEAQGIPEGEQESFAAAFPELEMRFHSLGGLPLSAYRPVEENAEQVEEVLTLCG
ncbi:hypothetical protein [Oceanidesulfovibrio marinus]|uniref:Shikimate kinase n=1 Tax=Oceanidesulfovibrio marinus TaxID=370038 RepID=A0A6P1ZLK5_9BACT|nr:hypothetical protein [Oceanidesulfovibrio marinus]TVM36673.1 hypothetical protein DQK91_01765 [Oceanidesulfovibrio marinus]